MKEAFALFFTFCTLTLAAQAAEPARTPSDLYDEGFDPDDTWADITRREHKYIPKQAPILQQRDLNKNMQAILFDWLVEVAEEYKLNPETVERAINYTLRFLEKEQVTRGKLQLLGIAAQHTASIIEKKNSFGIDEGVYICDNTYTKIGLNAKLTYLNNTLKFSYHIITPGYVFDAMIADMEESLCEPKIISELGHFLILMGYIHKELYYQPPSHLAAAAMLSALRIKKVSEHLWQQEIEKRESTFSYESASYQEHFIEPLVTQLMECWEKRHSYKLQAATEIYSKSKHLSVAK